MDKDQASELKERIAAFLDEAIEEGRINVSIDLRALNGNAKPGEVVTVMNELRDALESAKRLKAGLQKAYDLLSQGFVPEYIDALGVDILTVKGQRLEVRNQMRVNRPAGNRQALHQWLIDHGFENMVTETVNPSTLKAFVKDAMENQLDFPGELLKIEPYRQAVLVKR